MMVLFQDNKEGSDERRGRAKRQKGKDSKWKIQEVSE